MKRTGGYSMIEIVVALVIGGVLLSIAVSAMGPIQNRIAVRTAQNTFVSMVAKARATAIERGADSRFEVDFAGDSVWYSNGSLREVHHFHQDGIDIQSNYGSIEMFMTPRGFSDLNRNSFSGSVTVRFHRGNDGTEVTIMPLGQVVF